MPKVGLVSSKAISLKNVAEDISYVLSKNGFECKNYIRPIPDFLAKKEFDCCIIVMTFDPLYFVPYALACYEYSKNGIPSIMYVTTEGIPKEYLIHSWMKEKITYVANSNFTLQMLNAVNVRVKKVIYHGINYNILKRIKGKSNSLKKEIKNKLGIEVLFGTISGNYPRKNLKTLAFVMKNIMGRFSDIGFFISTFGDVISLFSNIKNVITEKTFGSMTREEVLALIGSFDYLIHPSLSEGFGLPVLEAQAMGVPVIFPEYEPLTEITHQSANFKVPIKEITFNSFEDGILYTLHNYDPNDMIEQIEIAYDLYKNSKSEYEDRSEKVKEFAKNFDIEKLYTQFNDVW
ncbi:MAG: glycosyltransferase [Candidatus Methanomethylicaceae archaeon]